MTQEWFLLWQIAGDGRALADEIALAAMRYKRKFKKPVEIVYIHPAQDDGTRRWKDAAVRLGAKPWGHLFLCAAQEQEAEANYDIESMGDKNETDRI